MTARLIAAGVLAAGGLLAGCQTTVPGGPQPGAQNSIEPSSVTSRPSLTAPTTAPTPPTASPSAPPSVGSPPRTEVLAPQNGYVFIQTKSGKTRCQISTNEVGCEAQFANSPIVDGAPANGVRLSAQGKLSWVLGNLGDIPAVTVDYRTYAAQGWTIVASEAGTRFTNDASSHGMFVSTTEVTTF